MKSHLIALALCGMTAWLSNPLSAAELAANDFGVVADGKTDNEPAILKMIQALDSKQARST